MVDPRRLVARLLGRCGRWRGLEASSGRLLRRGRKHAHERLGRPRAGNILKATGRRDHGWIDTGAWDQTCLSNPPRAHPGARQGLCHDRVPRGLPVRPIENAEKNGTNASIQFRDMQERRPSSLTNADAVSRRIGSEGAFGAVKERLRRLPKKLGSILRGRFALRRASEKFIRPAPRRFRGAIPGEGRGPPSGGHRRGFGKKWEHWHEKIAGLTGR